MAQFRAFFNLGWQYEAIVSEWIDNKNSNSQTVEDNVIYASISSSFATKVARMPPIIGARMKIPNLVELFPPFLDTTDLIPTKANLEVPIV